MRETVKTVGNSIAAAYPKLKLGENERLSFWFYVANAGGLG